MDKFRRFVATTPPREIFWGSAVHPRIADLSMLIIALVAKRNNETLLTVGAHPSALEVALYGRRTLLRRDAYTQPVSRAAGV